MVGAYILAFSLYYDMYFFFQNRNRHYLSLLLDDTGLPHYILVFGGEDAEVEWIDVTMSDCSYVL